MVIGTGTRNSSVHAWLGMGIFILFTGYVFLNAQLKDRSGDLLFLLLLLLALPRLRSLDLSPYKPGLIAFVFCFLGLTLASVLFPPSRYANAGWLIASSFRFFCAVAVVLSFRALTEADRLVLRRGLPLLCLLLSLGYIAEYRHIPVQRFLAWLSPFPVIPVDIPAQRPNHVLWHVKNYAFWQLLLMWGSVSLLWRRGAAASLFSLFVVAASVTAIFLSSSESAQLALVLAGGLFAAYHLLPRGRGAWLYVAASAAILLLPVGWVVLAPVKRLLPQGVLAIPAIAARVEIFDYTASLIRHKLLLGYGFGSTLFMPVPEGAIRVLGNSAHRWWLMVPGGHPHNLVFLFLVDHGVLGLLFLLLVMVLLGRQVYQAAPAAPCAPGAWSLVLSGLILFSLSFSIWRADVVLIYCMWLALVAIAAPVPALAGGGSEGPSAAANKVVAGFGLACMMFYAAASLLRAL